MHANWRHSLLFRTGFVLVLVFVLVGTLTVAISLGYNRTRAQEASRVSLGQLLDTVENTASIACFTNDEVLAAELASGLLKNSTVLAIRIQASDKTLADLHRQIDSPDQGDPASIPPLVRDVFSPFDPQTRVGRILLTPNPAVIREATRRETRIAMLQMGLQLLLVALAVAAAMLLQIIRPIKAISDRLHRLDAAQGDRLPVPAGHHNSEIGVLVADVNLMADHLVQTLNEERALRMQREIDERRYHAIFENAETGIFLLDNEGFLTSWNPAFANLMRLPEGFEPSSELSLFSLPWKDPARLAESLLSCLNNQRSTSADLHFSPHEGPDRWLNLVLTPIADQFIQGLAHDVTSHKEAERLAYQLAITDGLTGVANQLGLEQRLRELARACDLNQNGGFALILISLDDFKRINEGFGPMAGDEILREVAQRLSASVKSRDVVARLGADRFALLLVDLKRDLDAERVSARILGTLRQHYFVAGSPLKLRISAGIAFYPHDSASEATQLLRHVELALSHAKVDNGVRFFDPTLAQLAEDRRRLEYDLRQAIAKTQFVLFFQPIVDLARNRLAGAEALLRWRHPERGLVPPDAFIPLAEETGLISDIGLWVMEEASRQLAAWHKEGQSLSLSVNVSACQIPEGLPPKVLLDQASRLDVPPTSLALEITEGVLLSDLGSAQTWLEAVRASGFPVYLDDFGTGYSSLSYLKRFSVDRIKVDKSFVRDIATNVGDRALVAAVTAMAHSFALDVVAEGVEEAEHVRLLRRMGCRYAQGYYFSRPVPIEDFREVSERIPALLEQSL